MCLWFKEILVIFSGIFNRSLIKKNKKTHWFYLMLVRIWIYIWFLIWFNSITDTGCLKFLFICLYLEPDFVSIDDCSLITIFHWLVLPIIVKNIFEYINIWRCVNWLWKIVLYYSNSLDEHILLKICSWIITDRFFFFFFFFLKSLPLVPVLRLHFFPNQSCILIVNPIKYFVYLLSYHYVSCQNPEGWGFQFFFFLRDMIVYSALGVVYTKRMLYKFFILIC